MINRFMYAFLLIIAITGLTRIINPAIAVGVTVAPLLTWGEIIKHQVREDIDINIENDDDQ